MNVEESMCAILTNCESGNQIRDSQENTMYRLSDGLVIHTLRTPILQTE